MTTTQLELPGLRPLVEPDYSPGLEIPVRFAMFHAANPHVADALEKLAAVWLERHERASMKALFERLRWESGITGDGDPYVLNNNFTAYYARLLIERRPKWRDAFHLRALRSDRQAA